MFSSPCFPVKFSLLKVVFVCMSSTSLVICMSIKFTCEVRKNLPPSSVIIIALRLDMIICIRANGVSVKEHCGTCSFNFHDAGILVDRVKGSLAR